jgi:hypothetical protein
MGFLEFSRFRNAISIVLWHGIVFYFKCVELAKRIDALRGDVRGPAAGSPAALLLFDHFGQ